MPRHDVRVFTPEEAQRFTEAVRGERLGPLCTFALATGLRAGECLGLHWQDVDLENGSVRVRVTLQRVGGKLVLGEPKTDKSRRFIPLSSAAVSALREQRRRQIEDRERAGPAWQDIWNGSRLVFTSEVGTPVDPNNLTRDLARLLKRTGLPPMRFHDLRHVCASLLLAQGVPARAIMEMLGHDQISTTMDIYAHVTPALLKDAAAKMDAILAGTQR